MRHVQRLMARSATTFLEIFLVLTRANWIVFQSTFLSGNAMVNFQMSLANNATRVHHRFKINSISTGAVSQTLPWCTQCGSIILNVFVQFPSCLFGTTVQSGADPFVRGFRNEYWNTTFPQRDSQVRFVLYPGYVEEHIQFYLVKLSIHIGDKQAHRWQRGQSIRSTSSKRLLLDLLTPKG